jgi:hypothetical protein
VEERGRRKGEGEWRRKKEGEGRRKGEGEGYLESGVLERDNKKEGVREEKLDRGS